MFKHLTVNSCAEFCENRLQVLSIHRFLDELPLGINEITRLGARLSTHNKETLITHEDSRWNVLHLIIDPLHCRKRSTTKVKKDVCTKGNWRSLFLFILLQTLTRSLKRTLLSNHMASHIFCVKECFKEQHELTAHNPKGQSGLLTDENERIRLWPKPFTP